MRVGIAGTGRMGTAIAQRLLECFDRASHQGDGGVDSVVYPAYWIARQRAALGVSDMESAA